MFIYPPKRGISMEDNKIIIILLCIIIAILVVGVVMFSPLMSKEDSNIAILDNELNVGDSLIVTLTDSNGKPIANGTINIMLTGENGISIDKDIKTNSKGNAKFKMEEDGNYAVECKFDGNGQYASSLTAGKISVQKATTSVVSQEQASTITHTSKYAPNGGIYPEYGPEVDSQGITREYAIANDMHYIEMTIDGETVGGYTAYDPAAGCYHT